MPISPHSPTMQAVRMVHRLTVRRYSPGAVSPVDTTDRGAWLLATDAAAIARLDTSEAGEYIRAGMSALAAWQIELNDIAAMQADVRAAAVAA